MKMHRFFITGLILTITIAAYAQPAHGVNASKPQVGNPMPDFTLNNITHYKTKSASLKDFKGKWLFLDFWSPQCVTCIQTFPKVNAYQKEFKAKLTWVMIGLKNEKFYKDIEEFYEKMRAKQKLEMVSAYDSALAKQWDVPSLPHIIIVNPDGIVHSITSGSDMTREKIRG